MTIEKAVFDVMERLQMISDDSDYYRLVQHWLDVAKAGLIEDYLDANGWDIPPSMVKTYDCEVVRQETKDCEDCTRFYVDLPAEVLDLKNDFGVYNVLRVGGKPIDRLGNAGMNAMLRNSPFMTEGWYRTGSRINFTGNYPKNFKVHLNILISDSTTIVAKTDEYPAPSGLMDQILQEAEKLGRRKLATPADLISDGKHETST